MTLLRIGFITGSRVLFIHAIKGRFFKSQRGNKREREGKKEERGSKGERKVCEKIIERKMKVKAPSPPSLALSPESRSRNFSLRAIGGKRKWDKRITRQGVHVAEGAGGKTFFRQG